MTEVLLIGLIVFALLLAAFGAGLVIGKTRSDRWAEKLFGPEPVTGYSDPGCFPRSREFGG